jgi:hypothetical protein
VLSYVLQEVEDTLVSFLEKGASVETDVLAAVKVLLPPDVTKQLDDLIPPPPNAQPYWDEAEEDNQPPVIYTADSVLENQIGEQRHMCLLLFGCIDTVTCCIWTARTICVLLRSSRILWVLETSNSCGQKLCRCTLMQQTSELSSSVWHASTAPLLQSLLITVQLPAVCCSV